MTDRLARYTRLSNGLAQLDSRELDALVTGGPANGWGASQPALLGDAPIFVKRIPLTEEEYEHLYSTKNRFRLPLYYQYGVGSAPEISPDSWIAGDDYVKYWNGSKRIGAFIQARARAPYEIWLVLEHVPHVMHEWMADHGDDAAGMVDQLLSTVAFLRSQGVTHFDAHYGNVVTDGTTAFLTDYGLVNDRAFHLSADERTFLDRHRHYDYGEVLYSIGSVLLGLLGKVPAEGRGPFLRRYRPEGPLDQNIAFELMVTHAAAIAADSDLGVTPAFAALVTRFRDVILFMHTFFVALRANRRKNNFFDDDHLRGLLVAAGVSL